MLTASGLAAAPTISAATSARTILPYPASNSKTTVVGACGGARFQRARPDDFVGQFWKGGGVNEGAIHGEGVMGRSVSQFHEFQ